MTKRAKTIKPSKKPKQVWLVATISTNHINHSDDIYSDIIGIFTSRKKAGEIYSLMVAKEPIKGLDYNNLIEYDDVAIISRDLNTVQ